MIDDAKIRLTLVDRFQHLDPSALEMEEFDFGDTVGVSYYDRDHNERHRAQTDARTQTEAQIADDLEAKMRDWPVIKRRGGRPRKAA